VQNEKGLPETVSGMLEEAEWYLRDAVDKLSSIEKDDSHYLDAKYVSTACGIAYTGGLIALNAISLKFKPLAPLPQSIDAYRLLIKEVIKEYEAPGRTMLMKIKKKHFIEKPEDMNIPIYLDKDLRAFYFKVVFEQGVDAGELINQVLRERMEEIKAKKGI
jgi:hypothetical protein